MLEQVAEPLVRLLGRAEPGELPHRPEPAAVHRRIDPARERIRAGVAEVAVVVDLDRACRAARSRRPRSSRRAPRAFRRRVVRLAPAFKRLIHGLAGDSSAPPASTPARESGPPRRARVCAPACGSSNRTRDRRRRSPPCSRRSPPRRARHPADTSGRSQFIIPRISIEVSFGSRSGQTPALPLRRLDQLTEMLLVLVPLGDDDAATLGAEGAEIVQEHPHLDEVLGGVRDVERDERANPLERSARGRLDQLRGSRIPC